MEIINRDEMIGMVVRLRGGVISMTVVGVARDAVTAMYEVADGIRVVDVPWRAVYVADETNMRGKEVLAKYSASRAQNGQYVLIDTPGTYTVVKVEGGFRVREMNTP